MGAPSIGGTGVTITTDKDRDSKSYATFEDGVEIVGGNAGRESTTQGGHAVSVLQMGAEVCITYFVISLLDEYGLHRFECLCRSCLCI